LIENRPVPDIHFPFWLVMAEFHAQPMAFSSVKGMEAFLRQNKQGAWKIRLVNRYNIAEILKDLIAKGHRFVCYDAHEDGSGGKSLPVDEFSIDRPD
jgi:hypothetical protein